MTTMRRRKQFQAEVCTIQGSPLTECYVIMDLETSVTNGAREQSWHGRFSSLSRPENDLTGVYLLRPIGTEKGAKVRVEAGNLGRLGVTSDEYLFRGDGPPPEVK